MKKLLTVVLVLLAAPSYGAMDVEIPLDWVAPTENVDGTVLTDLAGYNIYYGFGSNNYTQSLAGVSQNSTSQTLSIAGVEDGASVYVAMTAFDYDGNESTFSNQVIAGPFSEVDALAPGAPMIQMGAPVIINCPAGQACQVGTQ